MHKLNMELDLQSLFWLYVYSCTHWLRPRNSPFPLSPRIWAHECVRYWSANIDVISLKPPDMKHVKLVFGFYRPQISCLILIGWNIDYRISNPVCNCWILSVYCIIFWTEIKKIRKLVAGHETGKMVQKNQGLSNRWIGPRRATSALRTVACVTSERRWEEMDG